MFTNWMFFLDVVSKQNILDNPRKTRHDLSPYQIRHINIKSKTQNLKLITDKEY